MGDQSPKETLETGFTSKEVHQGFLATGYKMAFSVENTMLKVSRFF